MPCKLGITSMSLGRASAGHKLPDKLKMAARYGYRGIEMFYEDIIDTAARRSSPPNPEPSHEDQLAACRDIRQWCNELDLFIICLQPLADNAGLVDREAQREAVAKLRRWIEMAHILETDTIQVPTSFLPAEKLSDDIDLVAKDMQEQADIGLAANPPIKFAYEALCFGTKINLWETTWEIVKKVDRPNFGLCLDSFNITGRIYGDPASPDRMTPNAAQVVHDSMERLVREVDLSKVFYVQIVDAERLAEPLDEKHRFHHPDQVPRMSWSRNCRLFYGEEDRGAYLPIKEVANTFFNRLGFEGWVSVELFNRRMHDEGADVCEELARRGVESWKKIVKDFNLKVDDSPNGIKQSVGVSRVPTPPAEKDGKETVLPGKETVAQPPTPPGETATA